MGVGADARGWGARRERRGGAGPRGPRRGGPIPGAGSEGGAGPGRPWRLRQRTPRGAGIRVGFGGAGQAGRLLWRTRSWSVARGRWEGGEVLRVLVLGRLFQYPSMRAKGVLSFASRSSALPSLPSAAVFLSLGAAQILFWGTWPCAPGAAQRPGREDRAGTAEGAGPHPAGAGNHAERVARCTPREKRSELAKPSSKDPYSSSLRVPLLQVAAVHSLPSPPHQSLFLQQLGHEN